MCGWSVCLSTCAWEANSKREGKKKHKEKERVHNRQKESGLEADESMTQHVRKVSERKEGALASHTNSKCMAHTHTWLDWLWADAVKHTSTDRVREQVWLEVSRGLVEPARWSKRLQHCQGNLESGRERQRGGKKEWVSCSAFYIQPVSWTELELTSHEKLLSQFPFLCWKNRESVRALSLEAHLHVRPFERVTVGTCVVAEQAALLWEAVRCLCVSVLDAVCLP